MNNYLKDIDKEEKQEWLDAFNDLMSREGISSGQEMLRLLAKEINEPRLSFSNREYINTIDHFDEDEYPGDLHLEKKAENIIRWNAKAMVVKAQVDDDLGGHIGTYASIALLYEVGFQHFWKAGRDGDLIFFQGHSSPGIYSRSFLEYRLNEDQLSNFRRETHSSGLSSYPHPWLMPSYWQFPTVSMGLGPLQAIYQARFMKYLTARNLISNHDRKVWCFCGDGEMDEPESLGALSIAAREHLDNLIFVVNCNLQRLDGPVRGNGKIIEELARIFEGNGWDVIKVLWSSSWDHLLDQDEDGVIRKRLMELCDGDFQLYVRKGPLYFKEHFFSGHPFLEKLKKELNDDLLGQLTRGAHDRKKIYAAYVKATQSKEKPVVILAHSIKGFGLGNAGEALNTAHNTKKLTKEHLIELKNKLEIPLSDDAAANAAFYRPSYDDPVVQYIINHRQKLGGFLPSRFEQSEMLWSQNECYQLTELFAEGSGEKTYSTTMAFVRVLGTLLRDKSFSKFIVPIVPDESRTFGMEGLFKQIGIYNPLGQRYQPVDAQELMPYTEAIDGQLLQEGINEAGAMASWIAAATSYSVHNRPMIPFYIYYSMFGFQRVGDLCWAAGDSRARGFLIGATAGRTTLNGEGLQHQDGHSHLIASTIPNSRCYDPAYSYELAEIINYGLKRLTLGHDEFFYITAMNENYRHPKKPEGSDEGIIKGLYLLDRFGSDPIIDLIGSGTILNEIIKAAEILSNQYNISSRVWSATSFTELRREALLLEHQDIYHDKKTLNYIEECLGCSNKPVVVATDYMAILPEGIRKWVKRPYHVLGTDGYGRSDSRKSLREYFEVSANYIVYQSLKKLIEQSLINELNWQEVRHKLKINVNKKSPLE